MYVCMYVYIYIYIHVYIYIYIYICMCSIFVQPPHSGRAGEDLQGLSIPHEYYSIYNIAYTHIILYYHIIH